MPRSPEQKLKLPYLMRLLLEQTDEEHPMSIQQMIDALADWQISAERKSIYDDLEVLRRFGLDIVMVRGKKTGYYVASRTFELPELKLLVDSVQSSKFITHKKTLSLIRKIESLASVYQARLLHRQVYVQNRVKTMNESVYYNVDEVSAGIAGNRKIRFHYFDYTVQKERRYRKSGAFYVVSPYAMIWDDENYYLVAYERESDQLKHYRMDKMTDISVTDEGREGLEHFAKLDLSAYSKTLFGMFAGEETAVVLRFADHLAGVVIDRFGKDVWMVPEKTGFFRVHVTVKVSPQFFAWLFGFGGEAQIMSPRSVAEMMRRQLQETAAQYEEEIFNGLSSEEWAEAGAEPPDEDQRQRQLQEVGQQERRDAGGEHGGKA